MRKSFLVLVVLLLVSMVLTNQAQTDGTRIFVNPSSSGGGLNPQTPTTIRPNADGTVGTLKEWTNNTVVLRPNSEGTYSDWAGRTLTLNPNGEGTYRQWSAWTHLQPTTEIDQNYTRWAGSSSDWNDWPNSDGDSSVVSASSESFDNETETSALMRPPDERRSLTIQKLRLNIVARYYSASDEQVQMMLSTVFNANVSSFVAASGWNGWTRTGSNPWLDKEDYPSNYVHSSVTGDRIGNFTFNDIPTGIAWNPYPGGVAVRLRIWQNPLGDDAIRIYLYNGTYWKMFTGLTPQAIPDPSYFEYGAQTDIDVYDFLDTRDKINNAKMAIEKVTVGDADTIYIEYACIHLSGVTTPSSYGVATGLTPSYTTYYSEWSTNPFTGLPWTWSDIDALQAGVRAIQIGPAWSGTLRVTQLYVGILTNQGFYTDWDEYPDPTGPNGGDEDFFCATADAVRQSSVLTDHGSEAWTISKVRVTAVADNPDTLDVDGREVVTGWTGWTKTGSDPYLDAADYNVNYIYTSSAGARIGNFTFRDAPLGTTAWDTATLRLRAWRTSTAASVTVYLFDGTSWTSYAPTLSTTSGSYVDIGVSGFLNSVAKINAAKMALEKLGASGTVYVDYACLSLGDREKIQLMIAESPFDFKANASSTTLDTAWRDWTRVPTGNTGTWLNSPDYPTSYVYASTNGYKIGFFPFQDIATGATWSAVKLRFRTWQTGADGSDYMNMEVYDGAIWSTAYMVTPPTAAAPGSYVEVDVSSFLNTVAKINAAQIRFTKVTVGTADTIGVDHAYIYLSGVAYCGAENALTTTYTEYTSEWAANPATGLAWTWTDIDNLEAGVRSKISGAWTGEIRVTQLYVKVLEAGTYAYWDDPLPDYNGDADYLSAISGKLNQSSGLENQPPGATWTPARVQVTIVAKTDISTDEKVRIMLVISGAPSPYYGTSYTLTTSYATYTQVWTTNPYTSGSWDWTTITNMQAGVQSVLTGTAWKGEIRITQLYVVVGRDGTYENWDEASHNGDADYFSATMANMEESSQLEDVISPPSWEIGRVRVVVVARTNVTTDEQVQLMLVIGGTAYYATEARSLTTTYATYTADWGKNPKFNIPWNWTAVNSLEAGVSSKQVGGEWRGEIRVTQLYVEIAGPRFRVNVDVENVANLYGYSIKLRYNTAITTATAVIFNNTFFPTGQTILREEVNDALGYVWIESQMPGSTEISGSGTLATVIFLVDSIGATSLDLRVLEFYRFVGGYPEIYMILGDVERDRKLDNYDLSILSNDYGSEPGDSDWNSGRCDFNADSRVDALDLFNQSRNYGNAYAYDGYFNNG